VQVLRAWGNDLLVGSSLASISGPYATTSPRWTTPRRSHGLEPDASGRCLLSRLPGTPSMPAAASQHRRAGAQPAGAPLPMARRCSGIPTFADDGAAVLALAPSATDMFVGPSTPPMSVASADESVCELDATTAWSPMRPSGRDRGFGELIFSAATPYSLGRFYFNRRANRTNVAAVDAPLEQFKAGSMPTTPSRRLPCRAHCVRWRPVLIYRRPERSRVITLDTTTGAAVFERRCQWNGCALNGLALGSASSMSGTVRRPRRRVLGLIWLRSNRQRRRHWSPICDAAVRTVVSAENAIFVGGDFTPVGSETPLLRGILSSAQILLESVAINSGRSIHHSER
jgi:hypothetical protein